MVRPPLDPLRVPLTELEDRRRWPCCAARWPRSRARCGPGGSGSAPPRPRITRRPSPPRWSVVKAAACTSPVTSATGFAVSDGPWPEWCRGARRWTNCPSRVTVSPGLTV